MNTQLVVVDDFLYDPEALRERALALDFGPQEYKGVTYDGVAVEPSLRVDALLSSALGASVETVMSFYRLGLEDKCEPTVHIHADSGVDDADLASVVYLSSVPPGKFGGTAFWTHRQYGRELRLEHRAFLEVLEEIDEHGKDLSHWNLNGFVEMRFNRMVAYPVDLFHSPYPPDAWGTTPRDGRLIWVNFLRYV